jgi:uncharacterized membrane protein YedE/YeeE
MYDFTPWSALAGGALIGLAASLLLVGSGRIAGVSGILDGAVFGQREERSWRLAFVVGLLAVGLGAVLARPGSITPSPRPLSLLALAGLLVGFGTRLGGGCTSGHGVCGLSRLSQRSLVATVIFILGGVTAATLVRLLGAEV